MEDFDRRALNFLYIRFYLSKTISKLIQQGVVILDVRETVLLHIKCHIIKLL
jgi:hypothetical protein